MEGLPPVPILVVSGSRGVGKTTLILGLARGLEASGLRLGGIASPLERGSDGRPLTIDALDLGTGERRRLAARGPAGGEGGAGSREGLPLAFSAETFAWAEERFREAARGDFGLVALDEIGPIEVDEGRGFFPLVGLVTAVAGPARRFILTVRESRAQRLLAFLGKGKACFVNIDGDNRDELPARICSWCGEGTRAPTAGPSGIDG
jgi:nucleoside-triphosphatase THEP1